jgi:hypothetical protein
MVPSPPQREVYIECVVQGGFMKVTAVDSATGTEATVFGPASAASREVLTRNAAAKLAYVLKKRSTTA